ncbi:ABC-2 transporter permease [Longirhabdus pacifica]|uniref:ABC-2 transporter permease n=1 Tax=Longirhabdus pacifica TaxID=2305227 RepID=UPI0010092734|nr:ABC-2 transporter permease [Longirhabdus pacifica]
MLNLIWREYILFKQSMLFFIPFILFLTFFYDGFHTAVIFLGGSFAISFNSYAYDEKAETDILLNSLPYTRKEIIASRYLGGIVHMIVSIAFTSALLFIFNKPYTVTDIAISIALFLVFASLLFPLFHVIKKGYFLTVAVNSFLLITIPGSKVRSFVANLVTAVTEFTSGAMLAAMLIYAVSWGISVIIYERKEF